LGRVGQAQPKGWLGKLQSMNERCERDQAAGSSPAA